MNRFATDKFTYSLTVSLYSNSSALEQATDQFDTVLELLQIGEKYTTIKNKYVLCMHASTEAKT